MAANVIIRSDERREQEAAMLRQLGGSPENSARENREFAEEVNARMNEVKKEVGIR